METKIIKAVFGGGTSTVTNKRTRTDYGQVLEIIGIDLPDTFECIFSNSATSTGVGKKMIGSNQRVLIPDEYLATGQTIYAWVLVHDGEYDGRHMYSIRIPVADMPDTSPEEPTPVEQSVISQAITALNSAVDTTTQKAQEATESADRAEQAAEGAEGYAERAESAQQAAESARDRATQAETSARTSAATATEKASEAISSATTASQSAITAENASESAQASADASYQNAQTAYRYAQDSATSAGQAESYASGASSYASDAQTHSQTASQKALEAAQSASTAVQAKTDAETAKTASQTAQGLAESARDEAVTAKADAESARDEAQSIANGISGKVEQIDSNTERIESLEDDRYKPYPTDSASGSIASFPDGADDITLKSCIVRVEPVQEGSGDPSPDNVRPISGFTGCEVQRTGKNLLPLNIWSGFNYNASVGKVFAPTISDKSWTQGESSITYETTATYTILSLMTPLLHKGTYHLGLHKLSKNSLRYSRYTLDKSFTVKQSDYISNVTNVSAVITLDEDGYIAFYLDNGSKASQTVEITIQVEVGDKESAYEPYTGQTYPITFPSEAGTVYGAYVDVLNGELVVDRAIVDLGTCNIKEYVDTGITNHLYSATLPDKLPHYDNNVVPVHLKCSALKPIEIARAISFLKVLEPNTVAIRITYTDRVYIMSEIETVEAMKQSLDGVQLVYELAEPIRYSLTPQEIKTLLGQNNLWANTGDTEVEYRADTKLYIEKLTQPEEYDMIADSAINSGQFFMVGNSLYRALANIASGATITVGTNAQRVSLSDALNLVNA